MLEAAEGNHTQGDGEAEVEDEGKDMELLETDDKCMSKYRRKVQSRIRVLSYGTCGGTHGWRQKTRVLVHTPFLLLRLHAFSV